jgi:PAS domain-containing protein
MEKSPQTDVVTIRKTSLELMEKVLSTTFLMSGQKFFEHVVKDLAEIIDADITFVGRLDPKDPNKIRTIAVCENGKIIENMVYDLKNTPCQNVVGIKVCVYPDHVAELFPLDKQLTDLHINGYVGIPLYDYKRNSIGILVGLYRKPVPAERQYTIAFELFASRIASEVELLRSKEQTEEQEMLYKMLFTNMPMAYAYHKIITDSKGKPIDYEFIEVNKEFEKLTGLKDPIGKTVKQLMPEMPLENFDWIKEYGEVALKHKVLFVPNQFVKELNNWYSVVSYSPVEGYFVSIFNNTTRQKAFEKDLQEKIEQLEQMNKAMIGRELKMVELKQQLLQKD